MQTNELKPFKIKLPTIYSLINHIYVWKGFGIKLLLSVDIPLNQIIILNLKVVIFIVWN